MLRLYYEAPADEHIVCLDEMTGMQALERKYPDIAMRPGRPVLREFEYIRHGTLCLMGGYNVRQRKLFGFLSEDHDSDTFVDLLDVADFCHPKGRGHVVCDNLFAHNTDDVLDWFDDHPRWKMHFTPKHASWLNLTGPSTDSSSAPGNSAAVSISMPFGRRSSIFARTGSKSTNQDLNNARAIAWIVSFVLRFSSILSSSVPRT